MNRHRDHLAPSDLTHEQLKSIRSVGRIRGRHGNKGLLLRTRYGLFMVQSKRPARDSDRYREHKDVIKDSAD
jgi:hypothetical protein